MIMIFEKTPDELVGGRKITYWGLNQLKDNQQTISFCKYDLDISAEVIFLLFCHCSYRVDRHRGIVNCTGKVNFNAPVEPVMFRAVPRGLAFATVPDLKGSA